MRQRKSVDTDSLNYLVVDDVDRNGLRVNARIADEGERITRVKGEIVIVEGIARLRVRGLIKRVDIGPQPGGYVNSSSDVRIDIGVVSYQLDGDDVV
jgi:hypothetical protein